MSTKTLEERTRSFWFLSRKWNGRVKQKIPTSAALKQLSRISDVTIKDRPLCKRTKVLSDEIIRGGGKKLATGSVTNVHQLKTAGIQSS